MVMNDREARVQELKEMVRKFREERGWYRNWDAKDFAISLVVEASEFLEHFQWHKAGEVFKDRRKKEEVAYELADVFYWVLAIADSMGIDLTKTFLKKLKKHEKRYPVEILSRKLTKDESLRRYYSLKKKKK